MSAICKRVFSFRQHGAGSAALLLCALLLLPCSGCSGLKRYSVTFADVFDTVTTFTAYASSRGEFDALAQKLHEQLLEDHRRFDVYREYPGTVNLCTLNRLAGGEGVQADREIAELLHMADTMYARTGGKLDISLGAVLALWQEARERAAADPASARPPEASLLREAARHCGMELLELDADGTVRFLDPELRLDVGAVAKGWAQARAGELLDGAKCASWLLNMGGSVSCRGTKPDGSPWTIGLEDPLDRDKPIRTFPLTDSSAVTSGVDQRYFLAEGVRYHHIIDPDTLYPGTLYAQVTVLLPDPALADALSTALFLMDTDSGGKLAEEYCARVLWILQDGSEVRTDGFPELKG